MIFFNITTINNATKIITCFLFLDPVPNYVDESINTVLKIQQGGLSGDILVFLTGKEEIMQAVNTLDDYNIKNSNEKYLFILIYDYNIYPSNSKVF